MLYEVITYLALAAEDPRIRVLDASRDPASMRTSVYEVLEQALCIPG